MNKKSITELKFIKAALLIIVGFLIYLGYLIFQPGPKVEVTKPIETSSQNVSPGDVLTLNIHYCSPPNVRQRVEFLVVDKLSTAYSLSSADGVLLHEGCNDLKLPIDINRLSIYLLENGRYKIRMRTVTEINPLRRVVQIYDTNEFQYTK